jgi:hypothetical protein
MRYTRDTLREWGGKVELSGKYRAVVSSAHDVNHESAVVPDSNLTYTFPSKITK